MQPMQQWIIRRNIMVAFPKIHIFCHLQTLLQAVGTRTLTALTKSTIEKSRNLSSSPVKPLHIKQTPITLQIQWSQILEISRNKSMLV